MQNAVDSFLRTQRRFAYRKVIKTFAPLTHRCRDEGWLCDIHGAETDAEPMPMRNCRKVKNARRESRRSDTGARACCFLPRVFQRHVLQRTSELTVHGCTGMHAASELDIEQKLEPARASRSRDLFRRGTCRFLLCLQMKRF